MCQRVFDVTIPPPAIEFTNNYFGGLNITGSNIFFMNAIEDPWRYAGMQKIHDPVLQKDMRAHLIDCKDCAHCVDLHGDNYYDS